MNRLMIIVFSDVTKAHQGARALHDLHAEGSIALFADAILERHGNGRVSLEQAVEKGPAGACLGLLTGSLVGLLGGPLGGVSGAGAGTLAGAAFEVARAGIGADFLDDLAERLRPGKAAVLADVDEREQIPVDVRMEALGGRVFRRNRTVIEDVLYERALAASQAELVALETEHAAASGERRARLEQKLHDARLMLADREDEVTARIEEIRIEAEARLASLQKQLGTVRAERKAPLENRIEEIRDEYRKRSARLHEAWERARPAIGV